MIFEKTFFEKPTFFAFTYTNPNMSFLFTAEYGPRLMLSGYDITVI